MGGWGSGPHRGRKKRTAEGCRCIDMAAMRRSGVLAPGLLRGALQWGEGESQSSVAYTAKIEDRHGTLRLTYRFPAEQKDFDYTVQLSTSDCAFGGFRWWFHCPLTKGGYRCVRRCRRLYLSGHYFGCRQCHELTYRSTQQSDARVYAAVRGGLDFSQLRNVAAMPLRQLAFALKVLDFERQRTERRIDRLNR